MDANDLLFNVGQFWGSRALDISKETLEFSFWHLGSGWFSSEFLLKIESWLLDWLEHLVQIRFLFWEGSISLELWSFDLFGRWLGHQLRVQLSRRHVFISRGVEKRLHRADIHTWIHRSFWLSLIESSDSLNFLLFWWIPRPYHSLPLNLLNSALYFVICNIGEMRVHLYKVKSSWCWKYVYVELLRFFGH